jgi:hypothetical protein
LLERARGGRARHVQTTAASGHAAGAWCRMPTRWVYMHALSSPRRGEGHARPHVGLHVRARSHRGRKAETLDQYSAAARTSTTSCLVYAGLSLFDWRVGEQGVGPDRPLGGGPRNAMTWSGDYPATRGGVEFELPQQTYIPKAIRNRQAPLLARRAASGAGFRERAGNGARPVRLTYCTNCTVSTKTAGRSRGTGKRGRSASSSRRGRRSTQ